MDVDGRGRQVPGHEQGFFTGATVFDHVQTQHAIYREEIFGPVLCILRAPDLAPLYPMWERFLDVRERLDPRGVFLNDHLRELFGL